MHTDRNALAVANGTTALHLALYTLGVMEGDEVIVPNVTFAASKLGGERNAEALFENPYLS